MRTVIDIMAKTFSLSCKGFAGLDQRAGISTSVASFPDMENFTVEPNGNLKTRCGYGEYARTGTNHVRLLWNGNMGGESFTLAYDGEWVYRLSDGIAGAIGYVEDSIYSFVPFSGYIYCLGDGFYKTDGGIVNEVEGYAPIVLTSASPDCSGGTALEAPNIITGLRRVRYNGDGVATDYRLPEKNIIAVRSVTVNGTSLSSGYINKINEGRVVFDSAPAEGLNNVEICYLARTSGDGNNKIRGCRYGAVFNNRLFMYGNPDYPNYLFHTELGDGIPTGEYFTDTSYHVFDTEVRSLASCFGRLLVFCKDCSYFTYPELRTDSLGNTYTSFPVYELNGSKGNLVKGNAPSVDNTPITICADGFNKWVSTDIADERNAVMFSERVFGYAAAMAKEPEFVKMCCRKAKTELWFVFGNDIVVYNYGTDCFYKHRIGRISTLCEHENGILFALNNVQGMIYLFSEDYDTDGGAIIEAGFSTPFCTFGEPYLLKSLYGLAVAVEGSDEYSASLFLNRGNGKEKLTLPSRIYLPRMTEKGHRMFRTRIYFKRFYSCKLSFTTRTQNAELTELHLFGKSADRSLRGT
ncbi:MAG: hypothetical protein IKK83_01760 [Clostridia bacterium]|nr:hypothetical protein [Clostridia bacterium]